MPDEAKPALTALRECLDAIQAGRIASIGSTDNTYCPQLDVGTVKRWRAALEEVDAFQTHLRVMEEGHALIGEEARKYFTDDEPPQAFTHEDVEYLRMVAAPPSAWHREDETLMRIAEKIAALLPKP